MPDEANRHVDPDHAGVAFHPPIMLGACLLAGFGLRALMPLPFAPRDIALLLGTFVVVLAFGLFLWAVVTMRRSGASIPTGEPTTVIVRIGPYRYSRNPIYVAMLMLLVGVGLWSNSLWFLGFAVLAAALLSWGVISREEAYLSRKFGPQYESYKSRVRRWL